LAGHDLGEKQETKLTPDKKGHERAGHTLARFAKDRFASQKLLSLLKNSVLKTISFAVTCASPKLCSAEISTGYAFASTSSMR